MTSIVVYDGNRPGMIVDAVIAPEGDLAAYYGWVRNVRTPMISRRFAVSAQGRKWPS